MAATRTRSKTPRPPTPRPRRAPPAPNGADAARRAAARPGGDLAALLQGAAEEAARLLGADGAFLYLLDPRPGCLRFTHSAGIAELAPDHRIADAPAPDRGRHVRQGRRGSTRRRDRRLRGGRRGSSTREATDRFVDEIGIRSMVVAPLTAGDEVFGALGTFSTREGRVRPRPRSRSSAPCPTTPRSRWPTRGSSRSSPARAARSRARPTIERSLRELGTRISGARDPEAVVQHTIDEALRLLDGDGARIDIVDPEVRLLRGPVLGRRGADPRDRLAARTRTTASRSGRRAAPS